jgi:predicted DNA-binding transcriptional regulator YafY
MREIINKMKVIYDCTLDRRTVYSAIDLLCTLGYDISKYEENTKGYYLRQREFEISETRMLIDAICSLPYISNDQTKKLIEKIQKTQSVHQRKQYRYLEQNKSDIKTKNKEVFLNIELLEEAISKKIKIKFNYLKYELDKELHNRKEEKYIINPYDMVCTNEHYYLVCRKDGINKDALYRIDLIRDIELMDEVVEGRKELRAEKTTYAFTGKTENIKSRCKNIVVGNVIDKFGNQITISPEDEEHFIASFNAIPEGIKFWCLQYLQNVEVLEPTTLRQEVIECLKNNMYQK